jgi:probable F420-dependent oxidoreductase
MDVGFALPQFDFSVPGERPLRWETVRGWAARAEDLRFGSVWLADHLFWDIGKYGGQAGPQFGYEPLVTLAALARATSRVRLGTLVLNAPLRPPTVLAKALASLDVLAGGRLIVGLGAGNFEPEYQAAGVPFARPSVRLAQLDEALDVLRGMFGGGPFTFDGAHYRAVEARCLPRPRQQPHPPLWVGGRGDKLLDLVARQADGWNTVWRWTPDAYRERLDVLEQACERVGRDPTDVTRSLGLYALVGEDEADLARRYERLRRLSPAGVLDGTALSEWRVGRLVGTVAEVREQLGVWSELGVSTLILCAGAVPFSLVGDDDVEMLAAACSL